MLPDSIFHRRNINDSIRINEIILFTFLGQIGQRIAGPIGRMKCQFPRSDWCGRGRSSSIRVPFQCRDFWEFQRDANLW